jgi:chromate transporter
VPPRRTERLATVARSGGAWGRSGSAARRPTSCLRQLCVDRRGRIAADEFEDAIAACNLLPGPSSTQLAIFCAGRVGGWPGALVGGAGFILPGLVVIIALAALFLSSSAPDWVRAAGGAGRLRWIASSPSGARRAPWPGRAWCSPSWAAAASRC